MDKSKTVKLSSLVSAIDKELIEIGECIDMHQFCAFWGAYDVFSYFDDIVLLVHGTSGCTANRHFLSAMGHKDFCDSKTHLTTNMKENDIIFGGEQKLIDALNETAEKYPDKNIAVLTNCCTDIIGDDVQGCIESLPEELRSRIVFMNTGGYSGKSYRDGTENAFRLLAEKLYDFSCCGSGTQNKTVNLFLRRWIWDPSKTNEIKNIINDLAIIGVEVNEIFDHGFNTEKLIKMGKADLNVALCPFFSRGFLDQLYTLGGIGYSDAAAPVGLDATVSWLKSIAEKLGIDADIMADERVAALSLERDRLREKIGEGRKCVIWNQTGDRLLSLIGFAKELGMKPIVVGVEPSAIREKMHIFRKEVLEGGLDATVYASKYIDEIRELVGELDDPIIFCNDNYFSGKKVFRYRFAHNNIYGLEGAKSMYAALTKVLDTEPNKYSLFLEE